MENQSFKENYRNLRLSQKKGTGTPLYTRFVNRWLGQVFASIFAKWNASPNTISYISAIISLGTYISFLFITDLSIYHSLILYFLLVIGFALDSADGLVARLLSKQSVKGEWLDHSFDAIKIPLGHGVAFLLIINGIELSIYMQLFLLLILVAASSQFLSNILKGVLRDKKDTKDSHTKEHTFDIRSKSFIRSVLTLPLDYGLFMIFFIFTPYIDLFYKIYAVWGGFYILFTILSFVKSSKEISRY